MSKEINQISIKGNNLIINYCDSTINPSEKAALNAVLNGFHITSGLSYKGVKTRCGKVVELELNNIKGVNDLTTMIGELTALQKLSVDNNGFWTSFDPPPYAAYLKSIPTEIGGCTDLTSLNISYQEYICLLYTSPSPRDPKTSRMPSSA